MAIRTSNATALTVAEAEADGTFFYCRCAEATGLS